MPDVFGLRAFDGAKPLTRMLTGQFPNEIQLLVPDMDIAPQGFHDILIEDLSASPTWQSCRVSKGCFGPCGSAGQNWTSFAETVVAVSGGVVYCLEGIGQ